jgi:hypothetical protein
MKNADGPEHYAGVTGRVSHPRLSPGYGTKYSKANGPLVFYSARGAPFTSP